MKVILRFIFVLFVLSSCGSSESSSAVQIKSDTVVVYKHDTITECLPYATVAGVYGGKVSKGELLHCNGLRLLNNGMNYKIISFKCSNEVFKYSGDDFHVQNFGSSFNNKTLELFNRLQASATVSFENIKAVNKNNDTVVLNSILVHLPS